MGAAALRVRVRRLPHGHGLELPAAASAGSAGYDLRAAIETPLELAPGERRLVPTGLILEIPPGWEGQVRPRSGMALRDGVTILNAPGTVDSDYRGEVAVLLVNLGPQPVRIDRGDRIAQLVFAPAAGVAWEEAGTLSPSRRGEGGFGSTGSG
ncbi:MAG TPA: dUTP diphosphatase [Thermoanaerobaculia bacterium]|nr:dUTP diphosphatase [Thermoanaerobaculia bacterium]